MTDLLKLKLRHTGNVVGKYHSYEVMGVDSLPEIEAVLVSTVNCYPDELEILIMSEPTDAPKTCVAKFTDMGQNKINCIKAVREHTAWGLKESKDWVESMPHTMTPKDGLTRQALAAMVKSINDCGGKAEIVLGKQCDNCDLRFRCFTER